MSDVSYPSETIKYGAGARTMRGLDETDGMSSEFRECVHEYGYAIVYCLRKYGLRPNQIHDVVREVWAGARQPLQKTHRGAAATNVHNQLDWLLIQNDAGISAKTLLRILWSNNMVIVPRDASGGMVNASLETVSGFNMRVTKTEKHRLRLNAAIRHAVKSLWPHLLENQP